MSIKNMADKDLSNCTEFGGICSHTNGSTTVPLQYLCFDENTDVVFDRAEKDGWSTSGVETTVPALTVQTTKASLIDHKSLFNIDGEVFGVIEIDKKKDDTTIVYLERQ